MGLFVVSARSHGNITRLQYNIICSDSIKNKKSKTGNRYNKKSKRQ